MQNLSMNSPGRTKFVALSAFNRKSVTDPVYRVDEDWIGWIWLDLGAQSTHHAAHKLAASSS
jgi:hypothetical protein